MNIFAESSLCVTLMHLLGHFLWQGAAVALLAGVTAGAMRRASARARYGVFVGALVLMVACPMITLGLLVSPEIAVSDTLSLAQTGEGADPASANPTPVAASELAGLAETGEGAGPTFFWSALSISALAPYITIAYALGVLLMLARLVLGLIGGSRLRRASRPVEDVRVLQALSRYARVIGLTCTPAIAFCERVAAPTLVGVLRPMILLPASVMTGLSLEQVEFLLLHELAHVRRYDHWVNVFQRVVEAVFFFHPGVWYVSHRARVEREHCCDDVVLTYGGNARDYAESLISVAACARGAHTPAAALGVAGKENQLRTRILRLLGQNAPQVRLGMSGWLAVGLVMVLGVAAFMEVGAVDTQPKEVTEEQGKQPDTNPDIPVAQPRAIIDELLVQIRDEDWWLRKVAAVQLGESGSLEAVAPLIGALKDSDSRVKMAAAEGLGKLRDRSSIKHLVSALQQAGGVRNAAAEALTCFDGKDVIPLLALAVMDTDQDVRQGGLWALGMQKGDEVNKLLATALRSNSFHHKDAPAFAKALDGRETVLVELAQDPDGMMRLRAGQVAVYLENFAPVEQMVITLTKDDNIEVRGASARSLGMHLSGERKETLVSALEAMLRDEHLGVAGEAAKSLSDNKWQPKDDVQRAWYLVASKQFREAVTLGAVSVEPLVHALQGDKSSGSADDSIAIVQALGQLKDARAVEPLSKVMRERMPQGVGVDENVRLVDAVIKALAEIGDSGAAPVLIEGIDQPVLGIKCIRSLGDLKATIAVPVLVERLDDKSLADAAAGALLDIGNPEGLKALVPVLQNSGVSDDVRVNIIDALVKAGGPDVVAALSKAATESGNTEVKTKAIHSLGKLKDPLGIPALAEALESETLTNEAGIRLAVIYALAEIGGPQAVKAIFDTRSQNDPPHVVAALKNIPGQESSDALAAIAEESNNVELRQGISDILRQRNDPRWQQISEKAAADAALKKSVLGE